MKEILVTKVVNGFIPLNEEEAEKLKGYKMGDTLRFQYTKVANAKFRRKWWKLAKTAYDYWTETAKMPEHNGRIIEPNFETFRKNLIIATGRYHLVVNIRGEIRKEADSISYGKMEDDEFADFYSKTIDVVLKDIWGSKLSKDQLLQWVDAINEFV